jgi:hypothetical protein
LLYLGDVSSSSLQSKGSGDLQATKKKQKQKSEAHQVREAQRNPEIAVRRFLRDDPIARNAAKAAAAAAVLNDQDEEGDSDSSRAEGYAESRSGSGAAALAQEQIAAALRGEWLESSASGQRHAQKPGAGTSAMGAEADVAATLRAQSSEARRPENDSSLGLETATARGMGRSSQSEVEQSEIDQSATIAALAGIREFLQEDLGMKPNRAASLIRAAVKGSATMDELDAELSHKCDIDVDSGVGSGGGVAEGAAAGKGEVKEKMSVKENWLQARRSAIILRLAGAAPDTIEGLVRKHEKDIDDGLLEMLSERIKAAHRYEEVCC